MKSKRNAGRPVTFSGGRIRSIYVDEKTWIEVKRVGSGNASAGLRELVRVTRPESESVTGLDEAESEAST